MASKAPGSCCLATSLHSGNVKGEFGEFHGYKLYTTGSKSDKIIVILTDIYGFDFINVNLVADELAESTGYQVLIPDILKGDPVVQGKTDLSKWLPNHGNDITAPIITGFLTQVKKELKPSYLVGIGYCFGAKWTIQHLSKDGLFDVGAVAHPSFVEIEEVEKITKPLLISAAETDSIFTEELRKATEETLKKNNQRYQLDLFSGVTHGFSIKGDLSDPVVGYAKQKVLLDQGYWFKNFAPKK